MPPKVGSRHTFTRGRLDTDSALYLTEREPFGYRDLLDNVEVISVQGDTWFSFAARFFSELPRGCGFWWVIADFQPEPPTDPTIPPEPGTRIVIPSLRTMTSVIFSERRRRDH